MTSNSFRRPFVPRCETQGKQAPRPALRDSGQAGFSLVELLIAIVVLLVGVVAVAELVPNAIRSNFRNRYDVTSLIQAQRLVEQMMAQDLRAGEPPPCTGPGCTHYFYTASLPDGTTPLLNLGVPPNCAGFLAVNCPILPPPPPPELLRGAPLAPNSLDINWGAAQVPGYFANFSTPDGHFYEARWNVTPYYANISGFVRPISKRIVLSVRGGPPNTVQRPATISTMVAWRED